MLRQARLSPARSTNPPWGHSQTVCRRFDSFRGRPSPDVFTDGSPRINHAQQSAQPTRIRPAVTALGPSPRRASGAAELVGRLVDPRTNADPVDGDPDHGRVGRVAQRQRMVVQPRRLHGELVQQFRIRTGRDRRRTPDHEVALNAPIAAFGSSIEMIARVPSEIPRLLARRFVPKRISSPRAITETTET